MKYKWIPVLLLLALLSGCAKVPTVTAEGEHWEESWTLVGTILGVEPPEAPWKELDNKAALAGNGLFYAAWTSGTPESYVNEDEETVDLYPAQIYLLLQEREDPAAIQEDVDAWHSLMEQQNVILETSETTVGQQEYTVVTFDYDGADNPYAHGAAAFAAGPGGALCVEVSCQESYEGDATEILLDFLEGCHFSGGTEEQS